MARRDHRRFGIHSAIIPERRWLAVETERGWVVSGWAGGTYMEDGDRPIIALLIGEMRCRRIRPEAYAQLIA